MAKSVNSAMERLWLTALLVTFIGSPAKQPQNGLAYAATRGDADSFVETYYVERDCVPGKKNVRNLKTGAARYVTYLKVIKRSLINRCILFQIHPGRTSTRSHGETENRYPALYVPL